LEERRLLSVAPLPQITVGRQVSAWSVADLQQNQVKIDYTVYNDQSNDLTGVLLTTTLQPGVSFVTATQLPDRSAQNLAWSLGTIHGFDRTTVELTVSLAAPTPLQLDGGASAYATLSAWMVSDTTPAAFLHSGTTPTAQLASTSGANTTDPYIQQEAAELKYDPQQIFAFLHNDVGYNSYSGSLRGARGTLWSSAGNSLDVASLGVALMRDSGIPAQYESGTLSIGQAQQLILLMFPASYQTVGYVPAGTQTADPANNSQLLSETENHYWFQFNAGGGMTDADPLMPGASVGQSFTAATSTFTEVPAALRFTVTVKLNAEITNTASSLFGGSGQQVTTVLDQTFDVVNLVGRPLTIGNFVNSTGLSALITSVTNTYSPYIIIGGDALDSRQDAIIRGQDYQEVLTNFPLGSQVLTGLFLAMDVSAPGGTVQSYQSTLEDRIGIAARRNGTSTPLSASASSLPLISPLDLTTISVMPSKWDPHVLGSYDTQIAALENELNAFQAANAGASLTPGPATDQLGQQATDLLRAVLVATSRAKLAQLQYFSDIYSDRFSSGANVTAYFDSPRLMIMRSTTPVDSLGNMSLDFSFDLRKDDIRALAAPGQNPAATYTFQITRGYADTGWETSILGNSDVTGLTNNMPVSAETIFSQAQSQGIPLITLVPSNPLALNNLNLSPNATVLISDALAAGKMVIVPAAPVSINGQLRSGWYEIDLVTGATIGVMDDGGHALDPHTTMLIESYLIGASQFFFGFFAATIETSIAKGIKGLFKDFFLTKALTSAGLSKSKAEFLQTLVGEILATAKLVAEVEGPILPQFAAGFVLGSLYGLIGLKADPSSPSILVDPRGSALPLTNSASAQVTEAANLAGGMVQGNDQTGNVRASGQLQAAWNTTTSASSLMANSLAASSAVVTDSNGKLVGSGAVALTTTQAVNVAVTGNAAYSVNGNGSLSFYGPAASNLGVSGQWDNYTTTITGSINLQLASGSLMVNGVLLPAGTYTIATSMATLSGSGKSTSPNFAGSASVTVTGGTATLGPGSGSLTLAGSPIDSANGLTLTGYTGTLGVTAGGATDTVTVQGTANQVIRVAGSPATITANQNSPFTVSPVVQTSLADSYTITADVPAGWTVVLDASGNAAVTAAPGTQGGTYAVRFTVQSQTDPDLVAQGEVLVNVAPTLPGVTLALQQDPLLTVPSGGADLPTAFRATIQNLGPAADTFNLAFSNLPSGFTLADSGTKVTIPPGATAVLGIYLQPTGQVPPPGTPVSFAVTATSASNPAIKVTQTESFIMPSVDGLTLSGDPSAVTVLPGASASTQFTVEAAGNIAENVTLAASLPTGLTLTGLAPLSLSAGQSTTETLQVTAGTSVPLNSTLTVTVTATFGPAGAPLTQTFQILVSVVVQAAQYAQQASIAAAQIGRADLAARLSDLATAATNLAQNPTSALLKNQTIAALNSLPALLDADPVLLDQYEFYVSQVPGELTAATTASAVLTALSDLGFSMQFVEQPLVALGQHDVQVAILPNSQPALPSTPVQFQIALQNIGTQTTTYDLSLSPSTLPSGVTGSLSATKVTLAPGASSQNLTANFTETGSALAAFGFAVNVSPEGASTPEFDFVRSASSSLTLRNQFVRVVNVTATPPFTAPGAAVDVKAGLLNVVNQQQQVLASYIVTGPGGVVFTSTAVPVTLTVQSSLSNVDLGTFSTTGLALGSYTISVQVTDTVGQPIPGASGQGSVLIGTPVTANLAVSPTNVPPGTSTVTNTLTINSQATLPNPLTVVGQASVSGASGVAIDGNLAYVGTAAGIKVVDITDPTNPKVLSTFATNDLGGTQAIQLQVYNSELVVLAQRFNPPSTLLIYSLATPSSPTPLTPTPFTITAPDGSALTAQTGFTISNNHVYLSSLWYRYFFGGSIFGQFGESDVIDISNPAAPAISSVIYNDPPNPTFVYPDGTSWPDGASNVWQTAAAGSVLLASSTTATGATVNGAGVNGLVMVVDTSNPAAPNVLEKLPIPGMAVVTGIAVSGNRAFVIGSSQNWVTGTSGLGGNVVVATLDLTNPQSPVIISSQTTEVPSIGMGFVTAVGNGLYVTNSLSGAGNSPEMLLFDTSDPQNVVVHQIAVPANIANFAVAGNLLFTGDGANLLVYQLGTVQDIPITAQVEVPNSGVTIVPGSYSVQPTNIIHGASFDTLVFELGLTASQPSPTITWQSSLTLAAGQSANTTLGSTIDFISQGTPGELTLPPTSVFSSHFLAISPTSQTVQPGATAIFHVALKNVNPGPANFTITVTGVPREWVTVNGQTVQDVTVWRVSAPSGGATMDVPITITPPPFAPPASFSFLVTAASSSTVSDTVLGGLTVAGAPFFVDGRSHGVVASLTPAQATAGQGTSADYILQIINTGSGDTAFLPKVSGLPAGISGTFGQTSVDVPPGIGNFRDLPLTLTVKPGTPPGPFPFTVTVTASDGTSSTTAGGSLNVTANGVTLALSPSQAAPGSTFNLTVTNTGTVTDTYNLALASPAALVAVLASSQVTLAAGASQAISVTTGAVSFADSGNLALTAIATSQGNPAVTTSAMANLVIPTTQGLATQISPPSETLPLPGAASFVVLPDNIGNSEDNYSASIIGTTGPVSASLIGLDGQPTQSVPIFRLPGLASGAILLDATALASGSVTVHISSLSDPTITTTTTAIINVTTSSQSTTHSAVSSDHSSGSTYGQGVTFTATVTADVGGVGTPTGTVQFVIDSANAGQPVALVNGTATLTTSALGASLAGHDVHVVYVANSSTFLGDTSPDNLQIVNPAPLSIKADNKTKVYGAVDPAFSVTGTGFVPGESLANLGGTLTFTTNEPSGSAPVGSYQITPAGLTSTNYAITFAPGTLSVTAAPLTITADNKTKVYGAVDPAFSVTGMGFVPGESLANLGGTLTFTTNEPSGNAPVGSYQITAAGLTSTNYAITFAHGTLSVTAAPLTITADNKTKVYGTVDPAFSVTGTGFVPGESPANLGGTLTFTTNEPSGNAPVGSYQITVAGLTSTNYAITFAHGTLSITAAPLTVKADNKSMVYGGPLPALTGTLSGVVTGDGITAIFTTTATVASGVTASGYPITPVLDDPSGRLSNYTISATNGVLNVTTAPLTITADNKSRPSGAANPTLTGSIAGIKNNDPIVATFSTTATSASPPGIYSIVPAAVGSVSVLANYNIKLVNGTLTVTPVSGISPTATILTASTPLASLGDIIVLTAHVTATTPGAGVPTGIVDFYDSTTATDLGQKPLVAGVATLSTTLSLGGHTISASYLGDATHLPSSGSTTTTIQPTIYVLDRTAAAALSASGQAVISIAGAVKVDSSAANAIDASGNARVTAGAIDIVGKYRKAGNAALQPSPLTGVAFMPDPLAGLPVPSSQGAAQKATFTSGSRALSPGVYSQFQMSGTAQVTLAPGVYVITSGGLSTSGQASVYGTGVTIYIAGGGISVTGTASVDLSAPITGSYAGVAIFQGRANAANDQATGSSTLNLHGGAFYAPSATLSLTGQPASANASLIVDRLMLSGNAGDAATGGAKAAAAAVVTTIAAYRSAIGPQPASNQTASAVLAKTMLPASSTVSAVPLSGTAASVNPPVPASSLKTVSTPLSGKSTWNFGLSPALVDIALRSFWIGLHAR
jgi:uncharacterized membrane protein